MFNFIANSFLLFKMFFTFSLVPFIRKCVLINITIITIMNNVVKVTIMLINDLNADNI